MSDVEETEALDERPVLRAGTFGKSKSGKPEAWRPARGRQPVCRRSWCLEPAIGQRGLREMPEDGFCEVHAREIADRRAQGPLR